MRAQLESQVEITLAARVAGEDLALGDYVTVMNEIIEYPSFLWDCSSLNPQEPVRIQYCAHEAGEPRKVIGVCLPFVYVKTPYDVVRVLDTRSCHLARLDPDRTGEVWRELEPKRKKKKKRK